MKNKMKQYFLGFLFGYLFTSFFSLAFPPDYFWVLIGFFTILFGVFKYILWRLNDDQRFWSEF